MSMFLQNVIAAFDADVLGKGLKVMLFGLIGVFTVIILIYVIIKILGSITSKPKNDDK